MVKTLVTLAALLFATMAQALQPYVGADKAAGADLAAMMAGVESKLAAAGFVVIGKHTPTGVAAGAIVVTEAGLLDAVKAVGGTAIVAAPLRVGVKADGTVSYINPEYWLRAFLQDNYAKVEAAGKAAGDKLRAALGAGQPFGGDVPAGELARYHYMFGMPRFGDSAEMKAYTDFDHALKTVRDNLGKGVAKTAKVYEIVVPDKKIAVFGFAQNDTEKGEAWWVNKIGVDHIAAMPWEVFIVDKQIYSLAGRYRTALAWPSLSMGQFMGISQHPDFVRQMALDISGF